MGAMNAEKAVNEKAVNNGTIVISTRLIVNEGIVSIRSQSPKHAGRVIADLPGGVFSIIDNHTNRMMTIPLNDVVDAMVQIFAKDGEATTGTTDDGGDKA